MTQKLYLAPIIQIERGGRELFASRCLLYDPQDGTMRTSAIMPNPQLMTSLCWVEATEETHAAIAADLEIELLGDELDRPYAVPQTLVADSLPRTGKTVREVARGIARHMLALQAAGSKARLLGDVAPPAPRIVRLGDWTL